MILQDKVFGEGPVIGYLACVVVAQDVYVTATAVGSVGGSAIGFALFSLCNETIHLTAIDIC